MKNNFSVVIIDDLSNSSLDVLGRIYTITGRKPKFYRGKLQNKSLLETIFKENKITDIIHFAGYKAVNESVKLPLKYYQNNLVSTLSLLEVMQKNQVYKLIFSSSATVYGTPQKLPLKETDQTGLNLTNPYGKTKYMIEEILKDLSFSSNLWNIAILRYFNPIGAHSSGLIGENPIDIPNNLMPFITQTAIQKLPKLLVFGDDYKTKDGSGVRDYIHVVDLAQGHTAALAKLAHNSGLSIYNLGTGTGVSVLEMIKTFEKVNKLKINYEIVGRRAGDVPSCYADTTKAYKELHWQAKLSLEQACRDSWNWQIKSAIDYS